jgi:rhodanese-related sulfurtransferase
MEVSPEELLELMQRPGPRAFHLVDARSGEDFVISRLLWAELIPLSRIATDAPKRFEDKNQPIVVYCRDGETSQRACELLREQGYEFVFHLTGGLKAWKKQVDPSFVLQEEEAPPSAAPSAMTPSRSALPSAPHEVSPEELHELMKRPGPRDFRLIDVREEDEFQICRLDWAELIPLAQLSEQAPRRLVDKDRPLVVYCHHGMRSQHACEWLRRAGYLHVFNLTGGIEAWADRIEPSMRRY